MPWADGLKLLTLFLFYLLHLLKGQRINLNVKLATAAIK